MAAKPTPKLTEAVALAGWLSEVSDRFWSKVDASGDCWEYTGYINSDGYGRCHVRDVGHMLVHRLAYELLIGPIPPELCIDHLCRNRRCVNPDHLEAVTPQLNTLRGATIPAVHSRKTHCPRGHPYDETNTMWDHGRRRCRQCIQAYCHRPDIRRRLNEQKRAYKLRQRAKKAQQERP